MMRGFVTGLALGAVFSLAAMLVVVPHTARAEDAPLCEGAQEVDRFGLLRQLSLDLRGRVPTYEEYEALIDQEEITEAQIVAMFQGEEFRDQLRDYHRGLLWPSLDKDLQNSLFVSQRIVDKYVGGDIYWSFGASAHYRNVFPLRCANIEQTEFDEDGRPVPIFEGDEIPAKACPDGDCVQEGWVWVTPWWAPDTQIKVCAFDAQEHAVGQNGSCDNFTSRDPGCGCGPNLERCVDLQRADEVAESLEEEPLRTFEDVIVSRRPYLDAFTTNDVFINRDTVRYYKYQSHTNTNTGRNIAMSKPLPELPWSEPRDKWVRYERDGVHSGVLTSLAFLVRFGAHRGRVNKLYTTFLCRPFPPAGVPENGDPCSQNPDLSERCGCSSCHSTIEPATVHFGRWETQDTFGYLDPEKYPVFSPVCAVCLGSFFCPSECREYYVSQASTTDETLLEDWAGHLSVAAFRSEDELAALDRGPAGILTDPNNLVSFEYCTVETLAQRLWNRPLTEGERDRWLPDMASRFSEEGQDYLWLLQALLQDERYRKIE
ncbi:MAG: hypothetical protein KC416_07780 [Myxococcales bacterium]|nr:hypothetical protein [Myxococcales bacterium]